MQRAFGGMVRYSGVGSDAQTAGAVTGATEGATAGAAAGPYGAAIGAVAGGAYGYYSAPSGTGSDGNTQAHDRFSVGGHRAIMTALINAKRWDDADQETRAWFAAGQGDDDAKSRFKPSGPAVLPGGRKNYSWVARMGHQSANVSAVGVTLPNGKQVGFQGAAPASVSAGLFGGEDSTVFLMAAGIAVGLFLHFRKPRRAR